MGHCFRTALRAAAAAIALVASAICPAQGGDTFTLVKDASGLAEGDTVVIASHAGSVAMGRTRRTNNIKAETVTISGETLEAGDSVQRVVLKRAGTTAWRLDVGDGYLCMKDGKDSYLGVTQKEDNFSKAEITIAGDTHKLSVEFQGTGKYDLLGCNVFNNPAFFTCYTITMNKGEVYLYKRDNNRAALTLDGDSQGADNGTAIAEAAAEGKPVDVEVLRTMEGDGGWYTLCLPFALTADDIAGAFKGAEFQRFASVSRDADGTVLLNFEKVGEAEAGVPHLVRPPLGETVADPAFEGREMTAAAPSSVAHPDPEDPTTLYTFTGTYDPVSLDPGGTERFVGSGGGRLVKPDSGDTKLKGLRAYFTLPSADTEAKAVAGGFQTGLNLPNVGSGTPDDAAYRLDETRISPAGKLPKGVYIKGGRKRLAK